MRAAVLCVLLLSCAPAGPGQASVHIEASVPTKEPARAEEHLLAKEAVQALQARYEESNRQSQAEALRSYLTAHRLDGAVAEGRRVGYVPDWSGHAEWTPETQLKVVARDPAQGLQPSEWLLREPDVAKGSPHLVFASAACSDSDSCGCTLLPRYVITTPGEGRATVIRLRPQIKEHRVLQRGTCSVGCGAKPPPMEPSGYPLASTDPSKVEIVDVPYAVDLLRVDCELMVPPP